ncbi:hypothetical protein J3E68DRAFT_65879 [Trichoderma sp. SZMC 28012]
MLTPSSAGICCNRCLVLIYPRIRYPKSSNPPVTAADSRHAAKLGHGIWHEGILSLGQAHGSCRLIRPWGSWHIAMFMLSRSLVPASWHRFNHACPPLTARSILGPWLIHATPVHLRFLPAVIYKYASLSRPSAKRKRQASTNTHSLCRNLDHIDTPDAQVASLPNSPGPYHTFSHPARKTTTPTLYGTQRASFSTLENALWTVHSQAWASLRDTSSLVMARSRRRATVCQPMSITFLHLAPTHTGKAESTPECSSAASTSNSTTKWLDSAG